MKHGVYKFENDISDDVKSIKQIRRHGLFMVKNFSFRPQALALGST